MDTWGPATETTDGNKYVLTIVDAFAHLVAFMTDMSCKYFFCGFLPIPANSCYFLLTPATRPQTPPGTSGSHPASSFMAFSRGKAISGAIMFWQEFQELQELPRSLKKELTNIKHGSPC